MSVSMNSEAFRVTPKQWALFGLAFLILYLLFREGIDIMVRMWAEREEYSHGFLIPVISAFLIYQRSDRLRNLRFEGSWLGVAVIALGLLVFFVGEFSTLFTIIQYGFLITLFGLFLAVLGMRAFALVAIPLLILFFMIPLPNFIYNNLSSELQLISSKIGVWVIRLFGISVYLEGNVIDLGSYKLQVVEACSGLRYLFPLMTLGFIMAYFYQAELWKRLLIFVSTIPITILMNSFRIGVIGVTVEHWGQEMAEGFLHDFEGWVVFMACFAVLFLEMWLLMRITGDQRPLNHVFGITFPEPMPEGSISRPRAIPRQGSVAVGLLLAVLVSAFALPEREEDIPKRKDFNDYPLEIGNWTGSLEAMEQKFIDALKFTDYFMANYKKPGKPPVNWYIAYYDSQRKGRTIHTPRACIPGGGWRIDDFSPRTLDSVVINGEPLTVNRVLVSLGDTHQIVYYWFKQRDRHVNNEYMVKWWLFWDALTRNRTDGALLRVTTLYRKGDDVEAVDAMLEQFVRQAMPTLEAYVPD